MDIIRTLIILSFLIIAHEMGHFWAARMFGVGILEFSVGFGPLIAKIRGRETQYSLRAVPVGGFVKMAGAEMVVEGEPAAEIPAGKVGLSSLPAWKKVIIILAGPVNNILLAAVVFIIMFAVRGEPIGTDKRAIIGNIDTTMPAYKAGISVDDRVLSVNGQPVELWADVTAKIRGAKGKPVVLSVEKPNGRIIERTIEPVYDPASDAYLVGIAPAYLYKRISLPASIGRGFAMTGNVSYGIVLMVVQAIRGQARLSLSGPIGAVGYIGEQYRADIFMFLFTIGSLNLFLALFNLLPIPVPLLDGGWVVIYLIEWLRKKEFTPEQKAAAQMLGVIMIGILFLFITYQDISTWFRRFLNR